nr:nonribosomal peptide synthetase [Verruciconidia persicina]
MDSDASLSILNANPIHLSGPGLLHDLVAPPSSLVALEHLENKTRSRFTYNDLHNHANSFAARISSYSRNGEGQFIVPVLIQQSPLLYTTLLGILKAGGAFCPLNIDAPPERIKFILQDVAARVVLVSKDLASKIPNDVSAEVLVVEIDEAPLSPDALNNHVPSLDDLAYVMYTSGSTGTPKGVGISHGAATQALLAHDRHLPRFSRFLQFAAPTFDVSVFEIFFPLSRGCTLVSVRRAEMLDDLSGVMREMEVDACELTPSVAGSLLRTRAGVPGLKLLLTIGEMLSEPVVREFGGKDGKQSLLWAMYGPTEATIHCTLQTSMSSQSAVGTIGVPLDTVSAFVIAPAQDYEDSTKVKILPRGEIGELAVGGHQLAQGYLNRPEQTAAAFISSSYGRLYRTGDKARLNSDGTLECFGRLSDGQVKLRGQRMELGEVEAAVLRTPGCHGAVARVHDSILICFCAADQKVTDRAVIASCERWLPKFMIPGEVVVVEEFPRLPSGKVDKKQLLANFIKSKEDQTGRAQKVIGVTELPEEIKYIIMNTFGLDGSRFTPATGLDSLSAIRLASSLRTHGYDISTADILRLKTMKAIQNNIWTPRKNIFSQARQLPSFHSDWRFILSENPSLAGLEDRVEDIFPCTPLQAAMLSETMQHPESYWNEIDLVANVGVTTEQLIDALDLVARNNEILRTGFATKGNEFVSVLFKDFDSRNITVLNEPHSEDIQTHGPKTLLSTWSVRISPSTSPKEGLRMAMCMFHGIYDGWSFDLVLSDLSAILSGFLPAPRPQFRDVTAFFHKESSDELHTSRRFWADTLNGWNKSPFPKLIDKDDNLQHPLTSRDTIQVPLGKVMDTSAAIGCSPQVIFQAALALVWSGILGWPDIVLGTVTSGRTIPIAGVENIMGPCIASLPLRVDLAKTTETAHLLNHIHSSNRAMMDNCTLSLSEIKKLTGLQSGESLYDVLFVYQESPETKSKKDHLVREVRHLDRLETKLVVEVEPQGDKFDLQMTYHASYFSEELVHRIMDQLESVALCLIDNPEGSVLNLQRGLDTLMSSHNLDPPTIDQEPDLAIMFETVAHQKPDSSAICFATRSSSGQMCFASTTYKELDEMSNRIAHFLQSEGVAKDQVVAVIMEKSALLYASILAVVKAGCGYLPLLPSTPTARVKNIFTQAKIRFALTDGASFKSLETIEGVCGLDVDHVSLEQYPSHRLNTPVDGKRLAYVIYTSGTTGEPKGVAVTQLNIASNIAHLERTYPKSQAKQSRLLQSCSQAFDVSVFEIFYAWHAGMCLCAGTNDVLFEDLESSIRELNVTHLSLTPTVASLIDPENVPDVEFLVTAGEPMTHSVLSKWGSKLWQGYGPSETTNICSVKQMSKDAHIEHLGWAFPNTSTVVLFPGSLEVAPVGWVGEFCFGGDQVAHGYLNLPEITARSFINHPDFGRLYRSGDMGRMLPDGSLVILGRIDAQLKLRGQRIEAGEIESTVTSTGLAVSAVAVLVRRNEVAADQLAAFYVPPGDQSGVDMLNIDSETNRLLYSALQARLPSYMIPSYLVPVSRIPSTSSGKIDRKGLGSWFIGLSAEYVEASACQATQVDNDHDWSDTEHSVARAASMCLSISTTQIGRWTPFATLGLDSVMSIGLARHLNKAFGIRVPVSAILRNPHIVSLARYIHAQPKNKVSANAMDVFPESFIQEVKTSFAADFNTVEQILPCTPLQEAMLSKGHLSYYNKVMLRLRVPVKEMRSHWEEMARRHGILRTCFITTSDMNHPIAQVILEGRSIPWLEFDVVAPSFDDVVNDHLNTLPNPVDSRVPPVSLAEFRYRGSTFLSFICHHSLYDGVAMTNLWSEVEALANNKPLAPFVPYEPFLKEVLSLPIDVEDVWRNRLLNYQPSSLFRKSASKRSDQVTTTKYLPMPLADIRQKIQSMSVSLLSLFQAAWANTLAIAHDAPDVCFGNVVSGRTVGIEEIDRLVAPCFNTIPVRKDVSSHIHRMDLVKSLHALSSETLPYQFTPLRLIQKIVNRQGLGLFDTLLLLQQPLREMDDKVWILEGDSSEMDVPLVCEVVPCPSLNSVVVNVQYDMNVVASDIAGALIAVFISQVKEILDSPYAKLTTRQSLSAKLRSGLGRLSSRREKPILAGMGASSDDEDWSDVEIMIRQVISELSGQPLRRVHRHTTIFQLGLDSINAVQVAAILRRRGLATSSSDVIECPSCAKLADRLSESRLRANFANFGSLYDFSKFREKVTSELEQKVPNDAAPVEAVLPCTPLQAAMMVSFTESKGQNYFNVMTYDVDSNITMADLSRAWSAIWTKHPMLRTGLVPINHEHSAFAMARYAADSGTAPLTMLNASESHGLDLGRFRDALKARYLSHTHLPPWHVLLAHNEEILRMSLFIHHALYDADSLAAILNGLNMILNKKALVPFPDVEPSLAVIMSSSLSEHSEAEMFWKGKAAETVVNPFPILTPLREMNGVMRADTMVSSLAFSSLKAASLDAGVTIQAVLQAAWTRILAAYVGESSVTFGVTLSARRNEVTRHAPLPCLATLPVVATNQSSNRSLLDYMMDFNVKAHKAHAVPLSQVQRWLGHTASPVFDTLLSYRKVQKDQGVQRQLFQLVEDVAAIDYPVSLEVEAVEGGEIRLSLTYKTDVIPQEQAALVLQQFDSMVAHIAFHPAGTEDDVHQTYPDVFSVLPPATPEMNAPVQYLHHFVEQMAVTQPDVVALEFCSSFKDNDGYQRWTYRELDEMGNRVAHLVKDRASVGSIVAVHFDKCPEAYFSILGILKAGCSFVALDPSAPKARKEFILQDSKTPCLLSGALEVDFAGETELLHVSTKNLLQLPSAPLELGEQLDPSLTCYCLYTSGTTGTPKGCEITHENAVQAMMAFQELFSGHWEPDSRWLQFAALHFDVSVLEQYWSWSVGITVVAAPKDLILDDLTGSINKLGITHIDLTPSLARLTHPDDVPSLCRGVFITGGESLKQEILDVWGPKAVIYNAYGPTEATIGVTMYQRVPVNGRPSNIGQQFPNVGSYVFRPGTEIPVLRGGVGELCVSGKLVGKGYLGRPELTEERFPTLKTSGGERIYRTGDLVRVLHDGCFDFLGRADDQIKLRGQRLEIGEINHAIRQVPEIRDAATIVVSQGSNNKNVLVAFIVATTDSRDKQRTLELLNDTAGLATKAREACRSRLPGYMVPSYFLHVPFIPLSVNNKAEAKELKRLFGEIPASKLIELSGTFTSTASQVSELGETARKIIETLAKFSGSKVEGITANTSIFDVGVDSISALRLSYMLKQRGLETASPAVVLRNPIVGQLSMALSPDDHQSQRHTNDRLVRQARQLIWACRHRYRALACRTLGVRLEDIEYIAPCSPLQQGIISKSMTGEIEGAYFNTFELKLHSSIVSVDKLKAAFERMITQEPVLRTVFLSTAEGNVQVALKRMASPWAVVQAKDEDEGSNIVRSQRLEWLNMNKSNITQPLQLLLVEGPSTQMTLVVNIFHAVYDGISFNLMLQRIAGLMEDGSQAQPETPSFVDALVHGPLWKFDDCKGFWEEHLQDWVYSPMPTLGASSRDQIAMACTTLPYRKFEEIRKTRGVSLQAVMLSLWTSVLQQYHPHGLTIGVLVSGRQIELPGVEHTIGPLFNTLPFHTKDFGRKTWTSLMRECHDYGMAVLPFQHVPLHKIQKWCSSGKALFESLFTLHFEEDASDRKQPWDIIEHEMSPDYSLALEIHCKQDEEVRLSLVAQGHVADSKGLGSLLDMMERHLDLMIHYPDATIEAEGQGKRRSTEGVEVSSADTGGLKVVEEKTEVAVEFQWTETASKIRDEIAALAGCAVSDVSESTTMLELGLDSVDVIKLSSRLKTKGIALGASRLMKLQNIASMATTIDEEVDATKILDNDGIISDAVGIGHIKTKLERLAHRNILDLDNVEGFLPPTGLQESMVAAMIQSDFEWYFNHDVMEIQEGVDVERLRRAWEEVVKRYSVLRTGFVEVDDDEEKSEGEEHLDMTYCQVIYKDVKFWKGDFALSEMTELIGKQRFLLLSLAHALYDGWSLGLVLQEVQNVYYGSGALSSPPPAELFLQKALSGHTAEAKQFWLEYLEGVSPTVVDSETQLSGDGKNAVWRAERVSAQPQSSVLSFCKSQKISLQTLFQACWAAVLASQTRQLDVVFGVVMSGRDDFDGAENLVFPTMNTVAGRSVLHGSIADFLRYTEDEMGDVRRYQGYPLRKAKTAVNTNGMELFNTLFMLQKTVLSTADKGSRAPLMVSVDGSSMVDYPICVEAEVVQDDRLAWRVACQSHLMSQSDAERMLELLDQVLGFFTTSQIDREVLSFSRDGVSVCGLDGFALDEDTHEDQKDARPAQSSLEHEKVSEDNESTVRKATVIRMALSQVSGVPAADIKSSHSLYNLGLDSISAIKVSTTLRKQSVTLNVRDLVRAKDISDMISRASDSFLVADSPEKAETQTSVEDYNLAEWSPGPDLDMDHLLTEGGLARSDVEAVLPAIPMQVYMLGAWENAGATDLFYPEFKYWIRKDCAEDEVWRAWREVVRLSPILRTCLVLRHEHRASLLSGSSSSQHQPMVELTPTWVETEKAWLIRLKIHHALYDGVTLPAIMKLLARHMGNNRISSHHDERSRGDGNIDVGVKAKDNSITPWARCAIRPTLETAITKRRHFWSTYLGPCPQSGSSASASSTSYPPLVDVGGGGGGDDGTKLPRKGYPIERVSHFERSAVPDGHTRILRQNATSHGVSVQAVFLAAWAKYLVDAGCGHSYGVATSHRDDAHLHDGAATSSSSRDPHRKETGKSVVFGIYLANRSDDTTPDAQSDDADHDGLGVTFPRLNLVPLKVDIREEQEGQAVSLWDVAAHVQRDLIQISSGDGLSDVGLWEIEEWTGWRVDTFVNFLALPGGEDHDDDDDDKHQIVSLAASVPKQEAEMARMSEKGGVNMGNVPVRDVFPAAMDIEASLRGDDTLDIGVFGPKSGKLAGGGEAAAKIVAAVVDALRGCE